MATDTTSLTEKTTETAETGDTSASAPRGSMPPVAMEVAIALPVS